MTPTILINGSPQHSIEIGDRGLAYGQGVFETILIQHRQPQFWDWHLERLVEGCRRLAIPAGNLVSQLEQELPVLPEQGVLKLTVTRGVGGRGYAVNEVIEPTRIIQLLAMPEWSDNPRQTGVRVRQCQTRLARQSLLAGIKHLNRLEQVLARAEWSDVVIREGLVCDTAGYLIEGTMSNLFFVLDGVLCTPDLTQCGVAGVLRRWVLDVTERKGEPVRVGSFTPDQLGRAEEIFLCNSLIGIWPVVEYEGVELKVGERTLALQMLLEKEYQEC
ncbi:aminodeoxychorismate lyase [Marinobacterium sp. D7]|uniref:aminodeoxychorismate lyase n=1 Tax=Marinobacterium ramblicola TaxID=2849041 RepID=UPI001C2D3756|nr:aminodeoxychorismate lyase [Marinobacterium ramblicola]MBV1789901.1 aminodeoxychorismate lyase [Marinobacterium ramblicola]